MSGSTVVCGRSESKNDAQIQRQKRESEGACVRAPRLRAAHNRRGCSVFYVRDGCGMDEPNSDAARSSGPPSMLWSIGLKCPIR
jgi:hypothetical protein